MTGMGIKNIRKSVAMCSPMAAHMNDTGWHFPSTVSSQNARKGRHKVMVEMKPRVL